MKYSTEDEQQFVSCTLSGPVRVYVKQGKIMRILPLEYNGEDDAKPWSIEARGDCDTWYHSGNLRFRVIESGANSVTGVSDAVRK